MQTTTKVGVFLLLITVQVRRNTKRS